MGYPLSHRERIIRPGGALKLNLRELWEYRELLAALTMRAVLGRYRQTLVGILWAVVRPVVSMVVLTLVFQRFAGLASGDAPYELLALAGVLAWQFFAQCVSGSASSLVNSADMIRKVYFPRLIVPAAACVTALIDMVIGLGVFAVMLAVFGEAPTWRLLALPGLALLALVAGLGPGLWLSALNVRYRDVAHLVPFLLGIGMFISPVGYASAQVPEAWQRLYWLNPMVCVIEGFRWSLLGGAESFDASALGLSLGVVIVLFVSGLYFFKWMERTFADVV